MRLPTTLSSALAGALAVTGFAPLGGWPVPILALAALFHQMRADAPRAAFLHGWAFGLGFFLAGVSWVYVSISTYGGLPLPLALLTTLLFCAFVAVFPGLALMLAARLAAPGFCRTALALPAAWVLLEWVRGWFLTGFPWLALGYSQAPDSPLAGFAPALGVYGVSLAAALAAGGLALLAVHRLKAGLGVALLFLAGWGLQHVEWTRPVGAPVSVALLQGNVAQDMKFQVDRLAPTMQGYARMALATDARLVILPETALPLFRSAVPADYLNALAGPMRQRNGDLLLGLPEDDGPGVYYNSVMSLGASPEGTYRKRHLVPFGEFVPFGFRWFVDMMQIPLGDFARGAADQPPIAAAGQRLAVNVCYEDAFGAERIHAARDATLLVNVSNDAWFGASLAPAQHLQIGAMRSLEAGRWQLRANNTGVTAILDHQGRVRAALPSFTTATLTGQAQGRSGETPFLRWGNVPALLLCVLLLAGAYFPKRRP
ncbi:MAG: apolipoprotein N-acyltransferase [Betaproteobacteria bacterium]|nr:apolipoprotein N-acyltransferase [Betaproteobacteria bacterium]